MGGAHVEFYRWNGTLHGIGNYLMGSTRVNVNVEYATYTMNHFQICMK